MNLKPHSIPLFVFLSIAMLVSACGPTAINTETAAPDEPETETQNSMPTDSAMDEETKLSDEEATQLMFDLLLNRDPQGAVEAVLAADDQRFIAVFLELMRGNQVGIVSGAGYRNHIDALEALSGETFGGDWFAWIEWYGGTDHVPPPGFTGWKGQLLGRIDPGFEEFLQDDHPSEIRVEEIQWGGVVVDGIPALTNPKMIPREKATYLEAEEPVFGISINGDHRAYPLRILDWHEMANDVVGSVPVSLAYCTLCGAGIAYDGRASNGETYTFGSSGFLFRSNKLMFDRQTRTLWNQLTGKPVLGALVGQEVFLNLLPVVVTSWADWQNQHPDTLVLGLDTGYRRPYELGAAYGNYFADEDTMFPVWQRSGLLETKDRVYALQVDGIPKAYPVEVLIAEQVVNDAIGDENLVLVATRDDIMVLSQAGESYNAGGEVRAFDRGDEIFGPGSDLDTLTDLDGGVWQVTEEALIGPDGELALRVNGHLAYWFGWFSFFPNTLLYEGEYP